MSRGCLETTRSGLSPSLNVDDTTLCTPAPTRIVSGRSRYRSRQVSIPQLHGGRGQKIGPLMPQTLRGIDGSVRYDLQRKQTDGIMSDTQQQRTGEIVHWHQGYRVFEFSDAI